MKSFISNFKEDKMNYMEGVKRNCKSVVLTISLLLIPLCILAQSKKSNQYYQTGVELLEAEEVMEALAYFQKCDSLDKKKLKPTSPNYHRAELKIADCYEKIADYYDAAAKFAEAIQIQTVAAGMRKNILGDNHPDYASALSNLAWYYDESGSYKKAVSLQTKVVEILKNNYGDQHPDYADMLHDLAFYLFDLGNTNEAIRLCTIAMEIFKKQLGEQDPLYAASLSNLARYNHYIGNTPEAIRLGSIAVEIEKNTLGEESSDYLNSLNNLARYYSYVSNYTEAIKLTTIVAQIREKTVGKEHRDYTTALSNLAKYYACLGNYAEAIRLAKIVTENDKKTLGEDHPYYLISLDDLAWYYYCNGNNDEAIKLGKRASEAFKKVLGDQHRLYAESLEYLSYPYAGNGNYADAIRLATLSKEIREKVFGEGHPDHIWSLQNLANLKFINGDYDEATDYYKHCYTLLNSYVLKMFSSLTNSERTSFWLRNGNFCGTVLPYVAYKHNDTTLVSLAYDSQLFSKGLLLNADLEIQNLITQSGDTSFINRYYKIKLNREILDELYQMPLEERDMDADSLLKAIENEERQLVLSSKELGDYTKNLSVNWKDVQRNLKDNELAIEFTNFKDTAIGGQDVYIALVLKKGMDCPELVKLFGSDELWAINAKEYYTTPKLYNLVWRPLAQYLKGVKNVYMSPSGRFHAIGIEYLTDEKGKLFAEKYNTYRLSSTREPALQHAINPNRKASTYGGIKYDFSDDDWRSVKDVNDSIRSFRDMPLVSSKTSGRSSGMVSLDGTKIESNAVANLLRTANYEVSALSDVDATEESFKQFSGSGIKILHIGTHGFFERAGDLQNAGYKFFSSKQQSIEDRLLSCSGLLFAGANSALDPKRNGEIPEGVDDGILTAKEISRLDFKGLDLVVLSACQTGLGEITGEGVFGLQRGFKKAGAQTIVMSLWKVSDEATQMLMIEFFKRLTAGETKRAAFLAAQETVRQKYPNPIYWAAFVMVDGLD